MATPDVSNIVKTGARVYQAPVGESNPDETSVAYGTDWGGNWERVGFTKEPLTAIYEDEQIEIEVEEELTAVERLRTAESLALETVLAELTLEYLQMALAEADSVTETPQGASQKPYEETGMGGEVRLAKHKWGFEGMLVTSGGNEEPIRVFIHKATGQLNGELTFSRRDDDYPGIPLRINALADPTQSEGQKLCVWQRVTGETS